MRFQFRLNSQRRVPGGQSEKRRCAGSALVQFLLAICFMIAFVMANLVLTQLTRRRESQPSVVDFSSISVCFTCIPCSRSICSLHSAHCICISLWRWSWLQVQWQQIDKFNYGQRLLHLHLHSAFFMLCSNWAIELSTHSAAASSGWSSCNADSIGNLLLKYILFD